MSDKIALVLSILSLISSIVMVIFQVKKSKKLNDITLESNYFDYLYRDLLVLKIPSARVKMTFNSESHLVGTEEILSVITEIRHKSMYFQYADKAFYDNLKRKLEDLENYIVRTEDKVVKGEDQRDFFNTIHSRISGIYNLMLSKYKGL